MVCRQKRSYVHVIYTLIAANQAELPVAAMCEHLEVSKSGYYDWHGRAPSKRAAANVTLLAQIEAAHVKSDATYGMPHKLGYWEIYKAIADLLQSKYLVAATNSSVLWLRGATEANAGRGAFSALIRGYTETQYQLRYGTPTPPDKLQEASNAVAGNLLDDLLGKNAPAWPKGQVPNIDRISFVDAAAVGDVLFGPKLDHADTDTVFTQNSVWSGALLFSLLRSDQTNRPMQGGGDSAKVDTLNYWRDVLYSHVAYRKSLTAAFNT